MILQTTQGITWMPTDGYPDGRLSNEVIGKGIAWEMEFASAEKDHSRLSNCLA